MRIPVAMPVITEAGAEAVVTAWFVTDGAAVEEGRLIAEVQAEKVSAEVHAPVTGTVVDLVPINEPVAQGEPICSVVTAVEAGEPTPAGETPAPAAPSPPRMPASPAARRLARELGVALTAVAGSGPGGRITEADVRAAATAAPAAGGEELTGMRATIARNLRRSHRETAPVTLTTRVDLTEAATDRFTARVLRVCGEVLASHPALSGTREDDRFLPAAEAVLCIAVDTPDGLVAPVVGRTGQMSLDEIVDRVEDLAARAAARRLAIDELTGGSFTVTNLGPWGIDAFTPLVNLPQVAILGVGALRHVAGIDEDGHVAPRREVVLSLTFDHAFVDGAPAAAFLADVADGLRAQR